MKPVAAAGVIMAACLLAAFAAAGCGLGPGDSQGSADMTITGNYGATEIESGRVDEIRESTTVMRALDDMADIDTKYGGGFVSSIDGLSNGSEDGRSSDWFYFVNGVAGDRSAADYRLGPDDRIWWDYRDWTSAMEAQAVVGSFPAPLVGGFDGKDPGVSLDCLGGGPACDSVESRLKGLGADVVRNQDSDRIRVLVGPWSQVGEDPDAAPLGDGPQSSGVFAHFRRAQQGFDLLGLDTRAGVARDFGAGAGLIAATRRGGRMPVWVVTSGSGAGLEAAASALRPELLARHYAAVVFDGRIAPLPLPGGNGAG